MAVTAPFASGFSGQSKTSGTTLALTGTSLTVSAGDDVFIVFAGDAAATAVAKSGTCTVGTLSIDQSLSGAGGAGQILRLPITGGGTLTGLTVTHNTATARAAVAWVLRGVGALRGTNAGSLQSGSNNAAALLYVDSSTTTKPSVGDFCIGGEAVEGPQTDVSGSLTKSGGLLWDNLDQSAFVGTTGGGAASNQSAVLGFVLGQSQAVGSAAGDYFIQTLGGSRNSLRLAAWYAPAATGTTFTQTLSVSTTASATRAALPNKLLTAATASAVSRGAQIVKTWATATSASAVRRAQAARTWVAVASASASVAPSRLFLKTLSAASAGLAVLSRRTGKQAAASSTAAATVARAVSIARSTATPAAPTVVRSISHPLAVASTTSPSVVRRTARSLAAATAGSAAISTVKVKLLVLAASATSVPAVQRAISAGRSASTGSSATVRRAISATRAASSAPGAALARAVGVTRSAATSAASALARGIFKAFTAASTGAAALAHSTGGFIGRAANLPDVLAVGARVTTLAVSAASKIVALRSDAATAEVAPATKTAGVGAATTMVEVREDSGSVEVDG